MLSISPIHAVPPTHLSVAPVMGLGVVYVGGCFSGVWQRCMLGVYGASVCPREVVGGACEVLGESWCLFKVPSNVCDL